MSIIPLLRRFEIVTYKDKSGTDQAQVPTAATVSVYRPGATSTTSTAFIAAVPGPYAISVEDIGEIAAGDAVQANADATKNFTVHSVTGRTTLNLLNDLGLNYTAPIGTRFVLTTIRPTIYSDPRGTTSLGTSITASSSTGRASGHLRNRRFDYIVSGTVSPARVYPNAEGGAIPDVWIHALDFASIQAAVDALGPTGGTVFIPKGTYNATSPTSYTSPLTLPLQSHPISLVGEGVDVTILEAGASSSDMIVVRSDHTTISGLTLLGAAQTGSGRGIVVGPNTVRVMGAVTISDCAIRDTASWGLYIIGEDPAGPISIWGEYNRVRIRGPRSNGGIYVGEGCTTQFFNNTSVVAFYGLAFHAYRCAGIALERCTFEDARNTADPDDEPYLLFEAAFQIMISHCWFEHHELPWDGYFIALGGASEGLFCGSVTIDTCVFNQRDSLKSHIIDVRDATRMVDIRNPRLALPGAPSTSGDEDIAIKLGVGAWASVIGAEVATAEHYYEMQIAEGLNSGLYIVANSRLRIPKLTSARIASGGDPAFGDVKEGDTVYNATLHWLQTYAGSNWGAVATFQWSDLPAQAESISDTTLVAAPLASIYRITALFVCTVTKPLATVEVTIKWRDKLGLRELDILDAPMDDLKTFSAEQVIYAIPGGSNTPISFLTTKSHAGGEYELYVRAERL